jgi:hypothetical protein
MSKLEVNAVEPQCGTNLTLGASGDTIIIPSGATISNQGTAAGFGPTGAVSWNTTKITANPNPAVTGVGYFADTTSAAFTITLPSSPAAGAVVGVADYANTFATNNLTIGRNGSNIGGSANNAILSTNGLSVTFVYVDATQGWIVTDSGNRSDLPVPRFVAATGGCIATCGNYKIHTFTGPGTFTVSCAGNPLGSSSVDYLIVGGGGGGGGNYGGGGGAGGFRESVPSPAAWTASPLANPGGALPVSLTGYPITVGGGGTPATTSRGGNGVSTTALGLTATGGGGGAYDQSGAGLSGGSGGGSSYAAAPLSGGGAGNTPPTSPPQGNSGGTGGSGPGFGGGGGGGATATGGNGGPTCAGTGGAGATSSINGTPTARAGGGGASGGGGGQPFVPGPGGTGGGGAGAADNPSAQGTAGTVNTGGGGGGKNNLGASSGAGGSGIVIIRYKFQ